MEEKDVSGAAASDRGHEALDRARIQVPGVV
jgi:hypothetical protein